MTAEEISSGPRPRILLVEDERDLARGVADNLEAEGYAVEIATEGDEGLERARSGSWDLLILDVMLPGTDGFSICRQLRGAGDDVPILFLTARSDPEDRIEGLGEGADDYLAKPFQLRELLLRVAALLRRRLWYRNASMTGPVVRFGGNEVDFRTYKGIGHDGEQHRLTHKEAMILKLLVEREDQVVSRDEILDAVWGHGRFPSNRTVDNFILRLRQRFERVPRAPVHFHTVHGAGYRFTRDPGEA